MNKRTLVFFETYGSNSRVSPSIGPFAFVCVVDGKVVIDHEATPIATMTATGKVVPVEAVGEFPAGTEWDSFTAYADDDEDDVRS